MNRLDIRALSRYTLNESSERYWKDAELNAYINLGIQEINQLIRIESNGTVSDTTTAGVTTIVLGSSVRAIVTMTLNGLPLKKTTLAALVAGGTDLTATGTPTHRYTTMGASSALTVNLWPIPDAAYAYTIWSQNELADLTGETDVPALPARWHGALRLKVLAEAYSKGGRDYGAATGFDAEWKTSLRNLVADLLNTETEGYMIRYVDPSGPGSTTFNPLAFDPFA